MDINLSSEQAAMVETARSFAKKSLAPEAAKYDAPGAARPSDLIKKAGELGFTTLLLPAPLGGLGAGTLSAGLVLEELAAACAGVASAMLGEMAGTLAAQLSGAEQIVRRLTEQKPDSGFNMTVAGLPVAPFEKGPDGKISGKAHGVLNADSASHYILLVRDGPEVACYAFPQGVEGTQLDILSEPLGLRAAGTGSLFLHGVRAPQNSRLGPIEPDHLLALIAPLQGCIAVGCARGALDAAENYARERYQGGDAIVRHDAVAHMILGNRAKINAARANLWKVMARNDEALDAETGKLKGAPDVVESVLARVFATDSALAAALDAVQCFGGYGYMRDYPVEKKLRDARSIGVIFGSAPELLTHIKHSLEEA